jgi:hypothetical protein
LKGSKPAHQYLGSAARRFANNLSALLTQIVWELLRGRQTFAKIKDSRLVPTIFLEWLDIQLVTDFHQRSVGWSILRRKSSELSLDDRPLVGVNLS